MDYEVNIAYCDKKCPIGMKAGREFLDNNNSAYEAGLNFSSFVEECFKTCQYKEMHNKVDQ